MLSKGGKRMARWGMAVVYGVTTIFLFTMIVSLFLTLLLKLTSYQESSLQWLINVCAFFAVFCGGFIAGGKGKERGWILGGATSLFFTLIVYLFQFLGLEQTFSLEQWGYHTGFLVTAMLGGMIGVNIASSRSRSS
jgi:putative membrane protein (TIGR04086 family)